MNSTRGRGSGNGPSLAFTQSGHNSDSSILVRINGKYFVRGTLDSAASHTFMPSNLVSSCGLVLVNEEVSADAAWVAEGQTIPVLGRVIFDLELGNVPGNAVMLRNVTALVLDSEKLIDKKMIYIGENELRTIGIHPLDQLVKCLKIYKDDSDNKDELELEKYLGGIFTLVLVIK
jgi:hypothetical protein